MSGSSALVIALVTVGLTSVAVARLQLVGADALADRHAHPLRAVDLVHARSSLRLLRWRWIVHGLSGYWLILAAVCVLLGAVPGLGALGLVVADEFWHLGPGGGWSASQMPVVVLVPVGLSSAIALYLLSHRESLKKGAPLPRWVLRLIPFNPMAYREDRCEEQLREISRCAEQQLPVVQMNSVDSIAHDAEEALPAVIALDPAEFQRLVSLQYAFRLESRRDGVDSRADALGTAMAEVRSHLKGLTPTSPDADKALPYAIVLRALRQRTGPQALAHLTDGQPRSPVPVIPELEESVADLVVPSKQILDLDRAAESDTAEEPGPAARRPRRPRPGRGRRGADD